MYTPSSLDELTIFRRFLYTSRTFRHFAPSDSCMDNKAPGSPQLAILSFKSGFHGRMLGSLSATRSKAIHKVGATFPRMISAMAGRAELS
jgi:4-aminobutyrate aminotransferase-like enzyme